MYINLYTIKIMWKKERLKQYSNKYNSNNDDDDT